MEEFQRCMLFQVKKGLELLYKKVDKQLCEEESLLQVCFNQNVFRSLINYYLICPVFYLGMFGLLIEIESIDLNLYDCCSLSSLLGGMALHAGWIHQTIQTLWHDDKKMLSRFWNYTGIWHFRPTVIFLWYCPVTLNDTRLPGCQVAKMPGDGSSKCWLPRYKNM